MKNFQPLEKQPPEVPGAGKSIPDCRPGTVLVVQPSNDFGMCWNPISEPPKESGHYLVWVRDTGAGWTDQPCLEFYNADADHWDATADVLQDGGEITHWAKLLPPIVKNSFAECRCHIVKKSEQGQLRGESSSAVIGDEVSFWGEIGQKVPITGKLLAETSNDRKSVNPRIVTAVYEIVDGAKFPLDFAHDGLKLVRIGTGNALDARDALTEIMPFVEEDYMPDFSTPAFKAAVEHCRSGLSTVSKESEPIDPELEKKADDISEAAGYRGKRDGSLLATGLPAASVVMSRSRPRMFTRFWLKTRPCARGIQINHDGTPPCMEFFVPWWAWPFELLHRAIFGMARLEPNAGAVSPAAPGERQR